MRRCITIGLVLWGVISLGASGVAHSLDTHTVFFDENDVSIDVQDAGDVVRVEGCRFDLDPGKPMLPVRTLHFSIPADMTVAAVEIISRERVELGTQFRIEVAQPPARLSDQATPQRVAADPSVYDSAAPYPASPIELLDVGNMGGYRIAGVHVHPLEYLPRLGTLVLNTRIELRLVLVPATEAMAPIANRSEAVEEAFADRVRTLVANPRDVDTHRGPRLPALRSDTVEYAIVTGSSYVDDFQPLADWKTKKGVPAQIFTTSWIDSNYPVGSDQPERIRNFIIDYATNQGLQYVLLGGDVDVVPARVVWDDLGYDGIRADLYFSDLDGTWNADGDGYWGEHPSDSVDMYGDVYVGRAPVNTSAEATNFVDQVLQYEGASTGGALPTDFQEEMLFMAEVLWGPPDYDYSDGGILKDLCDSESVPPRFDPITKLYQDDGNLDHTSAMAAMNAGPNITNHAGHCNYNVMSIGPSALYNSDMDALTNGSRRGIFYTMGCWAAAFDYDNIAEHYVNNTGGGGVAFVGNSRYGWACPGYIGECVSDLFDRQFFQALFVRDHYRLGATHADAKDFYVPDSKTDEYMRYALYELNVLGDPEMPIWTETPVALAASCPDTIPLGASTFPVTVTSGGSPVSGALVCVAMGDDVYEVGTTDGIGQVSLSPSPLMEGVLTVTATAHDHLPFEGQSIAADSTPQVVFITHSPLADTDDPLNPYPVVAAITSTETSIDPDSTLVMYKGESSTWAAAPLTGTGTPNEYAGGIPAQPCGTLVEYYILAVDTNGNQGTDPDYAPVATHSFAVNFTAIYSDDFESDQGWTVGDAGDDATTGVWSRCDPEATEAQPGDDHTVAGTMAYVTDCSAGSSQGTYDIDGGKTTLLSPIFDLSQYASATVSYYRWYSNDTGSEPGTDYWVVEVTDGVSGWVELENTNASDRSWALRQYAVESHVGLTDQVQFRFVASDELPGSIVEAGVDDFQLLVCPQSGDSEPPTVTMLEPDGGEELVGTTDCTIRWSSSDNVGVTVTHVLLSMDGGSSYPDTLVTLGTDSTWTWTVPDVVETTCRIRVACLDAEANQGVDESDGDFGITSVTAAGDLSVLPTQLTLAANRPNPFRASTSIRFGLPSPQRVSLFVFDVRGRLVARLADGAYPAGYHVVAWDGRSAQGRRVSAGVYFYRLQTDERSIHHKMLILR